MTNTRSPVSVMMIGGVGRSGTTLVERTLDTHPSVVALGEVIHLWKRGLILDELCGCGQAFSKCSFWIEVGQRAFGGWSQIDPERVLALRARVDRTLRTPQISLGIGSRSWHEAVSQYAAYYGNVYQAAAEIADADLVIDSSKQASLPYVVATNSAVDLRVLHCIRDSRAVAYSWTKTVSRPEARSDIGATMQRYAPSRTAVNWVLHNLAVEGLRMGDTKLLRLRYEDWVSEPAHAASRVLEFCDLPVGPIAESVGADWVRLGTSHTCSGNPMRFASGELAIHADETWRAEFPAPQRRTVTALTAPLLALYRYGVRHD